jgi:hypothetical protein
MSPLSTYQKKRKSECPAPFILFIGPPLVRGISRDGTICKASFLISLLIMSPMLALRMSRKPSRQTVGNA